MKTQLIALVALAADLDAGLATDLAEGTTFEVEADLAEKLLTEGKAKLANPTPTSSAGPSQQQGNTRSVKVRLLVNCEYGQPDDVVELAPAVAKALEKDGTADSDKAAVSFAASLPQNQPKKRK